jgi:transcriptional regulator with XRE-family HTH domain
VGRNRFVVGLEHFEVYGARLRERASARGLTGTDLGRRVGCGAAQAQRWMRGSGKPPTSEQRDKIEAALAVAGETNFPLTPPGNAEIAHLVAVFRRDLAARLGRSPSDVRVVVSEAAKLAALMWGVGGTVRVSGNRHLRAACREAGLTVINTNPSAKAWRAITTRRAPRPPHPAAAPHPAWPQAQPI